MKTDIIMEELVGGSFDSIHGELMNIFGVGVLILGKSGIGKSETAIELVFRGHKLVSDDAVDLKTEGGMLYGTAPDIIRHFMEIRGVGIIDVKALYGEAAVALESRIDFIIELEKWHDGKNYDRLDSGNVAIEINGVSIPKVLIPVDAGRNLAIVIEVAVRNFILKKQGYIPSEIVQKRMAEAPKEG